MSRRKQTVSVFVFLVLVGLASLPSLAQTANATILGSARDESGALLPGVEIMVKSVERGTTRTAITGDEGRYRVAELTPGDYEVSASLTGFRTAVRSGLRLTVGQQAVVDLVLVVGEIQERVVVAAEAPTVETTTSTISGLVDDKKIRDLPLNGRSFSDLATLQMGVVVMPLGVRNSASGFGTKISVSGNRPSSNSFLLDGTYVNDTMNNTPAGATGQFLGVDTLREFSVLTNTFSAEYGQSMGGIINAVTKSGTNELHGSLFWFHRNDNFDARNFFDPGDPPEFRRHQFGATVGGPIVRDKTFFFGGYEGLREALGITQIIGTLTDEARNCARGPCSLIDPVTRQPLVMGPGIEDYFIFFPRVNSPVARSPASGVGEAILGKTRISDEDNYVVKLDHNFSDLDSLFGRYTIDEANVNSPLVNFRTAFVTRNQYFTLEEKHIFSPTLLNVARFGYNRNATLERDFPLFDFPEKLQLVPTRFSALPELQSGLLGTFTPPGTGGGAFGGTIGGSTVTPRIFRTNLFEYADTLSWNLGRHSLKIGANIKRVQANLVSPQRTFGSMQFGTIFDFFSGRGGEISFITADSTVQRGMRFTAMGFFVQDDFQASPNLSLNLGVRYEPSTGHSEVNGRLSNLIDIRTDTELTVVEHIYENPTKKNFAPRIGLAWDPFGDGKTAIRSGFGIFYNIQMSEIDRISATSNPPFTTIGTVRVPFPYNFEQCCFGARGAGTPSLELIEFRAPQVYGMQWNLNIQRELFPDTALTVAYVGSRGVDLFRVYQWNQPDPVPELNPLPERSPFFFPRPQDRPPSSAPFGNAPCSGLRCQALNPNFSTIVQRGGGGDSYYHSFQLSLNKRFSHGFQVQGSYNWSKSLDTSSKQIRGPGETTQTSSQMNPLNTAGEKGFSNHDVTHAFTLNYTVELPGQNLTGAGKILGGWQLGGILTLASGVPETIILGYDICRCLSGEIFGLAGTDNRPDLISGGNSNPVIGDGREPVRYFDPGQFVPGPEGFYGNLGRNTLRIPGLAQFDFSLVKRTRITEGSDLQFRAEFFNIFNRANFADPNTQLFLSAGRANGAAGRITSTTTTARQIQFALKLMF
ncbi:MAG: TonB-dependent receptor [Acidobacteria bacterium]|nr:TonB-dependent receptor [Acidobacteriota bacterium]